MSNSFKVVIIGGESTGKTSIVRKIFRKQINPNEEPTVSVVGQDLGITIQSLNQEVNLELYDLPGQERYMVLNRMYLRDTNAAMVVYDITNRESLDQADTWINELREVAPDQCIIAACGNKMDSTNKQVSIQDGQGFARKHDIKTISEVSAQTGENVD